MDKNEFWNEKDNERYQKMKAEIDFDNLDFKGVKKFTKVTHKITKVCAVIASIIGIMTITLVLLYVINQWKYLGSRVNPDVIENLEDTYLEKFKVISQEINEKEEIYTISPKSNKKIVFTAYKNNANTRNDYEAQSKKYFVENTLSEELKNKLTIQEKYDNMVSGKETKATFLTYEIFIELNSFDEIEEAAKAMCEISRLALKDNKRISMYTFPGSFIKIGKYRSDTVYINTEKSEEEAVKEEKYNYIKWLKTNNLSTEGIPQEELNKYRPEYLEVIVNGKSAKEFWTGNKQAQNVGNFIFSATYNIAIEEYEYNLEYLISELGITNEKEALDGAMESINYKGKTYELQYTTNTVEEGKLPCTCRMSYLEQYFGAKITYDYKNLKIYIEM